MGKILPTLFKAELIKRSEKGENISSLCREAGVSRTIFYRWRNSCRQLPGSKAATVLASKRPNGKSHWRKLPLRIETLIIKAALKNPQASPATLAGLVGVSSFTVWKVLKDHNLNTRQLRDNYIYVKGPKLITPLEVSSKVTMMRRFEAGENVAKICREFGVSRTIFYRWLKRYQQVTEDVKREALEPLRPKGADHWRYVPGAEKLVLNLVAAHPELSVHSLSRQLPLKGNKPLLSSFGVYSILKRLNLNTYQKRLSFSREQAEHGPVIPLPKAGWIKQIFGRIPAVSAMPPPRLSIVLTVTGTVIFLGVFISWIRLLQGYSFVQVIGLILATLALVTGTFFFLYSLKYYITLAIVLSFSQQSGEDVVKEELTRTGLLASILGIGSPHRQLRTRGPVGLEPNMEHIKLDRHPMVSLQVPFYNEKNVALRAASAAINLDYPNYEVVLADDSTDETPKIIREFQRQFGKLKITKGEGFTLTEVSVREGVILKHLHRTSRFGFKGAALGLALKMVDPKVEFVSIFDADFVPYPDSLSLFLKYFKVQNNGSEDYTNSKVAAVQGYQWHVLNKSENWITRGVRTEYAGSYVIERAGTELYGGLKMISGSVYMIRRKPLEEVGWGTSITEDFELTLRLYEAGYKVVYTPYIQAPAECVSTFKRLIRQRMRWAEGHSFNTKLMFTRLMRTGNLTSAEKFEVLYLSPYYLQALFFLVGTFAWLLSEVVFAVKLPFWTALWGWSLVLTNMLSLPLVNLVGLFLEESEEKDYVGIASFVVLCYMIVPFQAYSALKGFIEKEEGTWFRTPKTGRVTDVFTRGRFYRLISGFFGSKSGAPAPLSAQYLALATANNRFDNFAIQKRGWRFTGRAFLALLVIISNLILSLAPYAPYIVKPTVTQAAESGMLLSPESTVSANPEATPTPQEFGPTPTLEPVPTPTINLSPIPTSTVSVEPTPTVNPVVTPTPVDLESTAEPTPTPQPEPTLQPTNTPQPTVIPIPTPTPTPATPGSLVDPLSGLLTPVQSLWSFLGEQFDYLSPGALISGSAITIKETNLKSGEIIEASIGLLNQSELSIELLNSEGEGVETLVTEESLESGNRLIITQKGAFRPGKYLLRFTDKGNNTSEHQINWGLLVVNAEKPVYKTGEKVNLSIAALAEHGHILCNANLALEVTAPNGTKSTPALDTAKECQADVAGGKPDYSASFTASQSGIYTIAILNTDTGAVINEYVSVENQPLFDVKRKALTRIYPLDSYLMEIEVTPSSDFTGKVEERIPAGAIISQAVPAIGLERVLNIDGSQTLVWDVDWKKNKPQVVSYLFDLPDASPYHYNFGPLQLKKLVEVTPTPTVMPSVILNAVSEAFFLTEVKDIDSSPSAQNDRERAQNDKSASSSASVLGTATASASSAAALAKEGTPSAHLEKPRLNQSGMVSISDNIFFRIIRKIVSILRSTVTVIIHTISGWIPFGMINPAFAQELTEQIVFEGGEWTVFADMPFEPKPTLTPNPIATPTPGFANPQFVLPKKNFKSAESLQIGLGSEQPTDYQFEIFNSAGQQVALTESEKNLNNQKVMELKLPQGTRPGKMILKITDKVGMVMEQEFYWGVLAINTDKTIYAPDEVAYVQMGSLDQYGHTLCDSNLTLEITDPTGGRSVPTIERSTTCGSNNVTDNPDYYYYYQTTGTGTYTIKLINNDTNYSIDDSFEVRSGDPVSVQRIGATRINPFKSSYTMQLKVKATQPFSGAVVEKVPNSFQLIQTNGGLISNITNTTEISWQADLSAGQEVTLAYEYQAPQVSPELFLLGPLRLTDARSGQVVFTEIGQWQIASDTAFTSAATGDWNACATWNTCPGTTEGTDYPGSADAVNIAAHTVRVVDDGDANSQASSVTFTSTSGTLNINGGVTLTVSGAVTVNNQENASASVSLGSGGWGTLNAASLTVGGTITPTGDQTTTLSVSLQNLNITNAITLSGQDTGPRENVVYLLFNQGAVSASSLALNTVSQGYTYFTAASSAADVSLTLSSATPISGTGTFTPASTVYTSVVNYSGASQTVKAVTYDSLTLSGSGTPVLTSVTTINNNLTTSGTVTPSTAANMTVGGALTVGASTNLTVNSTYTLAVTGLTTIDGTLTGSGSGVKTFTGGVDINIGGTYNNSGNSAVTLIGNGSCLTNDGTFTSGNGTYTINAACTLNGGNAITFQGAVAISGAVTVQNSNTNTVTVTGNLTGTAAGSTWQQNNGSTVEFKGAVLATGTLTSSTNSNTVKYTGSSSQTILIQTYHHLTIAHTGTVTDNLGAGTLTVNGNLVIGDDSNATTVSLTTSDPNVTVLGNMTVNTGSTFTGSDNGGTLNIDGILTIDSTAVFTAPAGNTASTFTLGGNFSNSGTFNANTGRITLDGNGGANNQTLSGSTTTTTFYELYITHTNVSATRTVSFTDGNSYAVTDNGTLSFQGNSTYDLIVTRTATTDHWNLQVSSTGTTVDIDYTTASWSDATGYKQIQALTSDNNDDGGNTINWTFTAGPTLSGIIYQSSSETTAFNCDSGAGGNNLPIMVTVNGAGSNTDTCDANTGAWSVTVAGLDSGETATIYIDGDDAGVVGSTILVSDGSTQIDVPIIVNRVILRDDVNGSITNGEIDAGNTADADDLITTTATTLTVASTYETHIYAGDTYAPGGDVTTGKLHIPTGSTYTGGSETLTLTGSGTDTSRPLYKDSGTFTPTSNTVNFTGDGATTIEGTAYYNLQAGNATTQTAGRTYTLGGNTTVSNVLTIGPSSGSYTQTLAASTYTITLTGSGTPFVVSSQGAFQEDSSTVSYENTTSATVTLETYNHLQFNPASGTPTYTLGAGGTGWFGANWSYRKKITLDASSDSTTLTDFPALVSISGDTELETTANGGHVYQSDGGDIVFTSSNGVTQLDHEIENYNGGDGTQALTAWVETTLTSSTTDIYMYYGNSVDSADQWNINGTWNDNYVGVWHLNNNNFNNSTSVANLNGTNTGTTNLDPAQVAGGRTFNSTTADNYNINVTDNDALDISANLTIEAWVRFTSTTGEQSIVDHDDWDNSEGYYLFSNGTFQSRYRQSTGVWCYAYSGATPSTATWYHVVGRYNSSQAYTIVNGNAGSPTSCANPIVASNDPLRFGLKSTGTTFDLLGDMDEVRISNTARSDGWISTEYANQNSPSTFFSTGSEEMPKFRPILHLKFNDPSVSSGQLAQDSSPNNFDGTLGADSGASTDDPTWQSESLCVDGKCLYFDGGDYVSVASSMSNARTASFWVKPKTTTEYLVDFDGGTHYIWSNSGTVTAQGFDTPTIYIDGKPSTTLVANRWQHIEVTTATGFTASAITIGKYSTNYLNGFIDDFKIYDKARTAAEVKVDFTHGYGAVLGARQMEYLSEGLIGYWKMDESSGTAITDSSGAGNNLTLTNAQESASGLDSSTTTTITDTDYAGLSSTNDVYNGMILSMSGGSCNVNGQNRTISDYDGTNKVITVSSAFSAAPDTTNCTYTILHQIGSKFSNGVRFDGENDYASATIPTIITDGNSFTVSAWINPAHLVSADLIAGKAGYHAGIWVASGNKISCGLADNSNNNYTVSTSASLNAWQHVSCTFNKLTSKITLYINGQSAGETSFSGTIHVYADTFLVGGNSGSVQDPRVQIDEVRLYNRALSPYEIRQLAEWAPGPVSYWKLEEGSGTTTNDSSLLANNGTITDAVWSQGKYGKGLKFDGVGDFVTRADDGDFDFVAADNFTVEAWTKHNGAIATNSDYILTKADGTNGGYKIYMDSSGNFCFDIDSDTVWGGTQYDSACSSGTNYSNDGKWHHLTGAKTGTTKIELFIDGVLTTSDSTIAATGTLANSGALYIGIDSDGSSNSWDGWIDEPKIYNYARTAKQIVSDMNGGHPAVGSPVGSALAHWKFDEGYGDKANNSGNGGSILNGDLYGSCPGAATCPSWTNAGKFGRALSFDGGDYAEIADNDALDITGDLSVSFWIYIDSANNTQLLAKEESSGNWYTPYNVGFNNDSGTMRWVYYHHGTGGGGTWEGGITFTNQAVNASIWQHVTYVRTTDNTTVKLYINGKLADTGTYGSADQPLGNAVNLRIGLDTVGLNQYFNGKLDELKIYNYALTEDEVKLEYNQGAATVLGTLSDKSGNQVQSAANEYCVPGDTTSCAGPVGEWKFEEKSGTSANDTSGNGNILTLTNSPTFTLGKSGTGINFDGSNQQLTRADDSDFDFAAGDSFTLEGWIKHNSASAQEIIISKYNEAGYKLLMENDGDITCGIDYDGTWSPADSVTSTAATYDDGKWHHVSCVKNANTSLTLYIDGVSVGTPDTSLTNSTLANSDPIYIGIDADGTSNDWIGQMDEVKIFNYARSAAQVAWDYNKGAPVANWKFDECQGSSAYDSSGNGYTGTITIGATVPQTAVGNCTTVNAATAWYNGAIGKFNSSLNFDGADDYVEVADNTNLRLDTGDFSISAWANLGTLTPTDDIGDIVIKLHGSSPSQSYELNYDKPTQKFAFTLPNTTPDWYTAYSPTTVSTSTWYHVVGVFKDNILTIYVNSVPGTPDTFTGTRVSATGVLRIGAYSSTSSRFNGKLDDVRIFNYALTTIQIRTLYNNGAVRFGS